MFSETHVDVQGMVNNLETILATTKNKPLSNKRCQEHLDTARKMQEWFSDNEDVYGSIEQHISDYYHELDKQKERSSRSLKMPSPKVCGIESPLERVATMIRFQGILYREGVTDEKLGFIDSGYFNRLLYAAGDMEAFRIDVTVPNDLMGKCDVDLFVNKTHPQLVSIHEMSTVLHAYIKKFLADSNLEGLSLREVTKYIERMLSDIKHTVNTAVKSI